MAGVWGDSWGGSWGDSWGAHAANPGAIRGAAHGTSSASATLTFASAEIIEFPTGGAFHPPRIDDPRKRCRRDDETLLVIGAI